jgi:hypothetical protein
VKQRLHITKRFLSAVLLICGVALAAPLAYSQPGVVLGNHAGCGGNEVLVPLQVTQLSDIGSFSIFIEVDTSAVDFVAVENQFQGLLTGSLVSSINYGEQSVIVINWFSMVPVNLPFGKLFDIRLKVKSNACLLNFASNCELTKSDLSVVTDVTYSSGNLSAIGSVIPSPQVIVAAENSAVGFSIPLFDNVSYKWQENIGNGWIDLVQGTTYSGVQEHALIISSVPSSPVDRNYRCQINFQECSDFSQEASLHVSLNGIGTNHGELNSLLRVYPNPAVDWVTVYTGNLPNADTDFTLTTIEGQDVMRLKGVNPDTDYKLFLGHLAPGVYLGRLMSGSEVISTLKIVKTVSN